MASISRQHEMKLKFLIFCLVWNLIQAAPMDDDTQFCVENYLKKFNLIASEFGNDEGISSSCNFMIPIVKKHIYENFREQLEDNEQLKDSSECIMIHLKDRDFANVLLALSVYQDADTSIISEDLRNETFIKLTKSMQNEIVLSTMDCKLESQYEEIFEELLKTGSSESYEEDISPEEEYCMRKYVVENDLIDQSYNLNLNPQDIDTSDINCDELFPAARQTLEDNMILAFISDNSGEKNEEIDACASEIIHSENIIDQLLPFSLLHELELSDEAKATEKVKFVQFMKNFIGTFVNVCLL